MEMEPGKLFIGGISWDTNEDSLREYFQTFGEVIEAVIMKDRNTGRARGFGFVVLADPAVAERVVREKHVIDGRTVEAKKAVPRDDQNMQNKNNGSLQGSPGPFRTKKIFVGGLASTVTESDFEHYFDQFGMIADVVVMYDHTTQRPRGFGFITYDSEDSVDRVLLKTFHELNGKLVEVKRAVPKELSSAPSRNQLGGYSNGLSRVSSFLNVHPHGYAPNSGGGYGVRVDGRFSPVFVGQNGYSPFSPSEYGMGSSFDPGLSPRYGGNGNFSPTIGNGRGWNPFYNSSSNRYDSPAGYGGGTSITGSGLSSTSWNMWGNGNFLNYASNSSKSNDLIGSRSGSTGFVGDFGSIGTVWGSSNTSDQGGGTYSRYTGGNSIYGNMDISFGSEMGGYRSNNRSSARPMSRDSLDGPFGNFYGGGMFNGDPMWRSSSPELEGSGVFGYELGKVPSDFMARNSAGYVGGYTVANRTNGGIAA